MTKEIIKSKYGYSSIDLDVLVEIGKEITENVTKSYDDLVRELNLDHHSLLLDFEKVYMKVLFTEAKKKYAALKVWEGGKSCYELEIKGFEYKKSDSAWISRTLQRDLLNIILEGASKSEIVKFILDIVTKINQKNIDLDEIGIPKGIGKPLNMYKVDNPWIRGARYANRYFGTNFGYGDKVKLIYLHKKQVPNNPGSDVFSFVRGETVPKEIIDLIDTETMIEKIVELKSKRILDVCGIKWDEINIPKNQQTLHKYFKNREENINRWIKEKDV